MKNIIQEIYDNDDKENMNFNKQPKIVNPNLGKKIKLDTKETKVVIPNKKTINTINNKNKIENNEKTDNHDNKENIPLETKKQSLDIPNFLASLEEVQVKKKLKHHRSDYLVFDSEYLLTSYGAEIFKYMKTSENELINTSLLSRHNLSSGIRTKMVDWMLEVFNIFEFSNESFFSSVYILDSYIAKTSKVLENKDIHLLGMVCMLMSTKFDETHHIKTEFLYENIGHKNFSKESIKEKEREVIETLKCKVYTKTTELDCINSFFTDFKQNNMHFIETYSAHWFVEMFLQTSIYFAKLLLHFDRFNAFPACYKALGCIMIGFEHARCLLSSRQDEDYYFSQWVKFILTQNKYENLSFDFIFKEIIEHMKIYDSLEYVNDFLNVIYRRDLQFLNRKYIKQNKE